ncbi:helix-turn-helix transcriptional regulator [Streptomyces glaucus]|uniref:HTH luxR-type domain-containing protein n=1 Tax=Streptomyces glaucus TaxID=284029 RepID=A0ABP5XM79_9ACTN
MTVTPAYASARIVGRDTTLGAVDALIGGLVENGTADLAVVTGPVGAGRSAVLDWAAARARAAGVAVGVARCTARESRVPYATVTQLMASLWPASRIGALAAGIDADTEPTAALAGMCDTLLTTTPDRPVLLAVDDLHLADPSSLDRLVGSGRAARRGPVLVLATSPVPLRRILAAGAAGAPVPPGPAHRLPLGPLTADQARELLQARTGRTLETAVPVLTEVAAGSPAVLCAVADRITTLDRPLDTDVLPELVAAARTAWSHRALATARGLPDDAAALLRALAAVGHVLDPHQLPALAHLDAAAVDAALDTLRACGLVGETEPPRLRHPWFADDVLAGMTRTERDALQARAAALRGEPGLRIGTVADMLGAVTGLVRPWAVSDAATAATPRPRRAPAHTPRPGPDTTPPAPARPAPADVTTTALRHALREAATETDRVALLIRLATVEAVTAPQAGDGRLRQVLLRHAGPETWPAVLHAADLLLSRGDAETARWVIADAHQRALTAVPDDHLRPLRALGRLAQGEKGGLPLVAPAPVHSDHPGHPAQSAVLAWTLATRADDRTRVLGLARSVLAEPAGIPLMCRIAAARALLCADDVTGGLAGLDAVAADATRADARAAAAQALLCRAEAAVRHGRAEDGLRDLSAATRNLPPASWHTLLVPRLTAAEALALIRCGRVEEARRVVDRPRAVPDGASVASGFLLYARAELALIDGDATRALLLLEECGRLLRARRWRNPLLIPWRSAAAVAHHLLGAPGTAAELLAEERRVAEHWGTAAAFAALWARTEETFTRLGVGLPRPPGRDETAGTPHGPGDEALTAPEQDVADLVLAGLANREIAGRLGIATRTVELRLTRIYRKLGVKGRAALAARLRAEREDG